MMYSLSKATQILERRFNATGQRITSKKEALIQKWASVAAQVADTANPESSDLWNSIYHAEMERTTREAGLRV